MPEAQFLLNHSPTSRYAYENQAVFFESHRHRQSNQLQPDLSTNYGLPDNDPYRH